ncbi:MAG: DsbA family protein [Pseudorhodobacter sp.]
MKRRNFMLYGTAGLMMATGPAFAQDKAEPAAETSPEIPDLVWGNPDASVTLIEYASYTCSHCANFHEAVFKPLKRDYIDPGKIKFIYREVYFDRPSLWAAMVARCGGDMRILGIQDMIYKNQREWAGASSPNDMVEQLRRYGRAAGLDDAQLDACLSDGAKAQAMVDKFEKEAEADGIDATPTLVLNGVKRSNMSYANLQKLLDEELAK